MLDVCRSALKVFESIGCAVEEAQPDYPLDAVWQAVLRIRGWQQGGALLGFYKDPAKRALLKPEAITEIEIGLKQSAYDITAASVVRSEWYQAVRRMFESYDYFIVPTAQVFPFDAEIHWPREIAGQKMETYHEWMKAVFSFRCLAVQHWLCRPASAASAICRWAFRSSPLIIANSTALRLGYAYISAVNWTNARLPALLT